MSRFRCYITPFLETGDAYGDEIEVTNDVNLDSISTVTQQIDNNEYDVGFLTFNDLELKLRNDHGKYSQPSVPESIFKYKRSNALFRLTWEIEDEGTICGIAICGKHRLSDTKTIYEGFINDESAYTDTKTQMTSLRVLSFESIITRVSVPHADISNGELISSAIYKTLNQSLITDLITVDTDNINVSIDKTIDDVTDLQTMTGKDALDEFLLLSNSILYVKDRVAYVAAREETAATIYTFYGAMSTGGLENIEDIGNIKTGMSQMFNFTTWSNKTFSVEDASSIAKYGTRKKEFSSTLITDSTKQQQIMGDYVNEFGQPKENFVLSAPINYETLELFFLDKVVVDYPTVYIAGEGRTLPIYDVSKYDESYYPIPESSLTIEATRTFKIMGIDIKVDTQTFLFNLRET